MTSETEFTLGVEEEFLLIDRSTRELAPDIQQILPLAQRAVGDHAEPELQRSQIETGTEICATLAEVRCEVTRLRCALARAAAGSGAAIGASGTHPFSDWASSEVTPKAAYLRLERDYQQIAREQVICGCHIHVGVSGPEQRIQILNRVRPWLSTILALSANSPFWCGADTGYESYRTELWRRWPTAETPGAFADWAEYEALVATLHATGSIDAPARLYWDVRPSAKFDTLEFRMTDVCLSVDEAVMAAGLVRALVIACGRQVHDGCPAPTVRPELVRAATWRAARYGVEGSLIDLEGGQSLPARDVVGKLLEFLEPALGEQGDRAEIEHLVQKVFSRGTGAARQRRAYATRQRFEDVVDLIIAETAPGC
jgi:carboxylate-amine ligase